MTTVLHPDSLAALLLCSTIALPRDRQNTTKPLSASNWHSLIEKLRSSPWQGPGDLLGESAATIEQSLEIKPESADRIAQLLDRGGQIAFEIDRLASCGIWVLTESDDAYPIVLGERLVNNAPPVLFGAGPASLLAQESIALVGSRDLDPAGEAFARAVGSRCAAEGVTVVSGGARGADRISMMSSLQRGGTAIGVLADSLQRTLRDSEAAQFIRDEQLVLVTPFDPAAGFSVGNAMARNKLIYGLARLAVVVSSAAESGGTWAGATENLKHHWIPLFVRIDAEAPDGNYQLIQRGGVPLSLDDLPETGRLFDGRLDRSTTARSVNGMRTRQASTDTQTESLPGNPPPPSDLFELIWPALASLLLEPQTVQSVADTLVLEKSQARKWLQRAVDGGRAEYLPGRPPRYRQAPKRLL
jgi:predicted Rossmann fold nucleotide-binding protein DprA/Smf involved in DNA uptake